MSMRKKVFLVTDGASRGNHGSSAIGFGIYDKGWNPLEKRAKCIGVTSNNEAEYEALIRGLRRCVEYCRGEVEHFTDSRLVAKQVSGEWVVRAPNLKPLAEEVSKEKLRFERVTHKYLARSDSKIHRIDGIVNEKISSSL